MTLTAVSEPQQSTIIIIKIVIVYVHLTITSNSIFHSNTVQSILTGCDFHFTFAHFFPTEGQTPSQALRPWFQSGSGGSSNTA